MAQQDPGWNGQRELGIIKAGAGGESDNPNTTWRPKVKDCNFRYSAPLGQPDPEAPHYADDNHCDDSCEWALDGVCDDGSGKGRYWYDDDLLLSSSTYPYICDHHNI